jgi:hypothetical protein
MSSSVDVDAAVKAFQNLSAISPVDYETKPRTNGVALVFRLANPSERFFEMALDVSASAGPSITSVTVKKGLPSNRLQSPEARLFLRVLSESLNINRYSFGDQFFSRYTESVSNAESQIVAAANNVVYGRRGAGKSSLLLYALKTRQELGVPSVWVDMQIFEKRADTIVVVDILLDIFAQLSDDSDRSFASDYEEIVRNLRRYRTEGSIDDDKLRMLLPELRHALGKNSKGLFIFLDDFHVLDLAFQPKVLGFLYSLTRGNNVFLKLSCIETFTKTWDSKTRIGLQVPHDAQLIKLDYNLTMPDRAADHIEGILDAHAKFCGLPSVSFLCNSPDVISRLIWVSAGVPRDALNMFAQAMVKGNTAGRSKVAVSDVNLATSEMISQKLRDIDADVSSSSERPLIESVLDNIKEFCVKQQQKNAFLVEIRAADPIYQEVLKLVDLRLIHVISEGLTVGEAGRKYLALILDYGFYTGIRAARSVDLFNKQTKKVARSELRHLPVFKHAAEK